ncbi:MAG TPA: reductase [Microbacteriaceae bacterium]|nr:reductase [Microbacteriaceae bacterium]
MRQVLILGGTAWLGREIAHAALAHGAEVTCLARGNSGEVASGARLVIADRAAPGAYDALLDREWDDVIEISYDLGFVQGALAALTGRARHWTLVSSVSVYADDTTPGADERADLVEPTDLANYAHAKVAAERATQDAAPQRLLIARPGLIAGPGDGSDRFGYWPGRFAAAACGPSTATTPSTPSAANTPSAASTSATTAPQHTQVLLPDARDRATQAIDVRDLADWIVRAGEAGDTGVVNAVGDVHELVEVLDLAAEAAGFAGEWVVASDARLIAAGVHYWAGPHSLPLWLPNEARGFMRYKNDAYRAHGGMLRPLAATIADVRDDERERGLDRPRRSGLTRAEERAVIVALAAPAGDESGTHPER